MIRKLQKMVKPWRVPLGLTILVYILFRVLFLVGYVPTTSMEPTLLEGSFFIGSRVFQEPKVGDIIVFEKDGTLLVKRIAAGPGDTVDLSKLVYMAAVPIPIRKKTIITVPDGWSLFWEIMCKTPGIPGIGSIRMWMLKILLQS